MSDQKKSEVPEEVKEKQLDPKELTEEQLGHIVGGFSPVDGGK